jgi:hypothetical protein
MAHPHPDITSPFSSEKAQPSARGGTRSSSWKAILIGGLVVALLALTAGGAFLLQYLNDPFRKLEEFPVGKYFDSYRSLAGLKFRSDMRVEADLGWKDGIGRLMVFTPTGDNRQLAVFIPPVLSGVFFNKGQNYTIQLEVKEGGLIYADSCRKN